MAGINLKLLLPCENGEGVRKADGGGANLK